MKYQIFSFRFFLSIFRFLFSGKKKSFQRLDSKKTKQDKKSLKSLKSLKFKKILFLKSKRWIQRSISNSLSKSISNGTSFVLGYLFTQYPKKVTINLARAFLSVMWLSVFVSLTMSWLSSSREDRSLYEAVSLEEIIGESNLNGNPQPLGSSQEGEGSAIAKLNEFNELQRKNLASDGPSPFPQKAVLRRQRKKVPIKYKAQQVFVRPDINGSKTLPSRTLFIGKLLSHVDTRQSDILVRVVLPLEGRLQGHMSLPQGSVLWGAPSYPGHGPRVFIQFHKGVLPNGREIKISAMALDAKDFASGLMGHYHSGLVRRMGSTLGLGFVSGASEVLQEKEALGEGKTITTKPTLRNAFLGGVSGFVKKEGNLQLKTSSGQGPYITLKPGKELVVSLTETLKMQKTNHHHYKNHQNERNNYE